MNKVFLFAIEEVFVIRGRGTIIAPGVADAQQVQIGDILELRRPDGSSFRSIVQGLEIIEFQADVLKGQRTVPLVLESELMEIPKGTEVWRVNKRFQSSSK